LLDILVRGHDLFRPTHDKNIFETQSGMGCDPTPKR
jgi:hypothetical protein